MTNTVVRYTVKSPALAAEMDAAIARYVAAHPEAGSMLEKLLKIQKKNKKKRKKKGPE